MFTVDQLVKVSSGQTEVVGRVVTVAGRCYTVKVYGNVDGGSCEGVNYSCFQSEMMAVTEGDW